MKSWNLSTPASQYSVLLRCFASSFSKLSLIFPQAGSILPQALSGGGLLGRFAIALAKDSATISDGGAGQAVCQLGGLVRATGAALIGGG